MKRSLSSTSVFEIISQGSPGWPGTFCDTRLLFFIITPLLAVNAVFTFNANPLR